MRILLALVVIGLAVTAVAQPWRYVDEKGQVHITNDIMKLPAKQRERILKRMGLEADAGKSVPVGMGRRPGREDPRDGGVEPPPPSDAPRRTGGDESAVNRPAETPAAPSGDEEADRRRWQLLAREAQERIFDAKHRRENARLALEQAQRKAITVPSGEAFAAQEQARKAFEAAEKAVGDAEAGLKSLQEQARQQGVPPGWLR